MKQKDVKRMAGRREGRRGGRRGGRKQLLAITAALIMVIGCLAACGNAGNGESGNGSGKESGGLTGSLSLVGSTSMQNLVDALSEAFMEEHEGVTVTPQYVGSSAGIEAVSKGTADIGNSSRNLKDSEKESGIVENIVAIDGIAVCLDPANTVTDLTKQQLTDIYTGKITNWSELGGSDMPIIVIGREAGSGTRSAFEELLGIEDACVYANELDNTGAVIARVAATPGSIGYASLDAIDESVISASLEGVAATAENIKAGTYFLSRPFVMATKGEISEQSELVRAWFDFVLGEEGQKIAANAGLITVD